MSKRLALAVAFASAFAAPSAGASTDSPVVLELFTSQGCSSCPPADRAIAQAADRPDVIALSFNVTYWDHLGWKDTFSRPEFTARQVAYERGLGHDAPFTPQVVANGRVDAVANSTARVNALIARARAAPTTRISAADGRVSVESGVAPRRGADVWLVRFDPRTIQVPVRAGENNGKTLPQRNVVRRLVRLGGWNGRPESYVIPAPVRGLRDVVLVQGRDGGAILAALRL